VEEVDFITTPGYLSGPGTREAAGLPPDTGPFRVVSNLAVLGFHPQSKRMMLLATQPGVSVEDVIENTGFDLVIAEEVESNPPPTEDELQLLRGEIDQDGLYI
jgi:glutaconate CoA-transferase subunit B